MKITYLLPVVSHVRFRKRISALQALGAKPRILAFERDYYKGKPWPMGYRSLGKIAHEHYYRRVAALVRAIPIVTTELKDTDVVYGFGLDMLLLAWIARLLTRGNNIIVYELGDLGIRTTSNFTGHIVRWLESIVLRQVNLLVLTSGAYVTSYFRPIVNKLQIRYLIVENKLDRAMFPSRLTIDERPTMQQHKCQLRIGYFGLIRCQHSLKVLKEVSRRGKGHVQVYMRGIFVGLEKFQSEIQNLDHVEYKGSYVSPDELPDLYGSVDIAWVAYRHKDYNIIRTNRFYEACFYQCPMIGQQGSIDGYEIADFGLGICIDLMDVERAVDFLLSITQTDLLNWRKNLENLPRKVYEYTDEHQTLFSALKHIRAQKAILQ